MGDGSVMKIGRLIFAAVSFAVVTGSAFADEWSSKKFDNGEVVYKSGHYDVLIVGPRGVGFKTTQAIHDYSSVAVSVDGGRPIPSQIQNMTDQVVHAFMFKNSNELMPLITKAKSVEITFNTCGNAFKGDPMECFFTKSGNPYKASWTFDTPINK